MEEYLSKMKGIVDNLTLVESPISNLDFITQTLLGLDNEYKDIVVQLTDKEELTWIKMQAQLLSFENGLEHISNLNNLTLNPSANIATKGDGRVGDDKGGRSNTRGGAYQRELRRGKGRGKFSKDRVICQSTNERQPCKIDQHNYNAYIASPSTVQSEASNHITYESNKFQELNEHEGKDSLTVSNGASLKILALFHDSCCFVKDKITGNVLLEGRLKDELYQLPSTSASSTQGSVHDRELTTETTVNNIPATPALGSQMDTPNNNINIQQELIASQAESLATTYNNSNISPRKIIQDDVTNSSHDPLELVNQHQMMTRSKASIFKTKHPYTTNIFNEVHKEIGFTSGDAMIRAKDQILQPLFLSRSLTSVISPKRLFFYEYPYTTQHFLQTILPTLKNSLSLTLQYFFPFAANLICPPKPRKPHILFVDGGAVSFTVVESAADFNHLSANYPRDIRDFHPLTPKLSTARDLDDGSRTLPLMAIQATVLPYFGFCIGVIFHHAVADGRALRHFMKSWASICRTGGFHKSQNHCIAELKLKINMGSSKIF
ncbi:hypothetical protein L6164_002769 [Bauhinia variegata]|uniref:Uncharacterized protein n=1 Tax=Bauhinia variegata TaxID=167791 RepID=A0ACB9PZ77_BAUVA|nr:hypothetical protein L6164_002769 [Bauhinia variegata]